MPLVINTNVASLNAQRALSRNTVALGRNLERLASGFRINRAADDAAGLQISETLRAQIRGVTQAISNSEDGTNLLSVAEGSLQVINDNLQRIRELAVQAANDTNGTDQRDAIAQEINKRQEDITRIANSSEFNGIALLADAGVPANLMIQVGANSTDNDVIDVASALGSTTGSALALSTDVTTSVDTNTNARTYLGRVDTALATVSQKLATLGAFQNRLQSAISNLEITRENYESAESRIRNVDVAKESAEMARNQILQQAAASILAQANQTPSLALSLIRGG